jgi:hypothetical protein
VIATKDGVTARAFAQIASSTTIMTPLEDAFENAPDIIQEGIEFSGSTSGWIAEQLAKKQANEKIVTTVESFTKFMKEISDGKPISMKQADKILYGDPKPPEKPE